MEQIFLTRPQIKEALGITENTLKKWVAAGMPEYRPPDSNPRYDLEECRKWMKEQIVQKEG